VVEKAEDRFGAQYLNADDAAALFDYQRGQCGVLRR